MKKKILFSLLSLGLVFVLSGCTKTKIILNDKEATIENFNKIGKKYQNYDFSFEHQTFKKKIDKSLDEINSSTNHEEILSNFIDIYKMYRSLNEKYSISQAYLHTKTNDEEYKKTKDKLFESLQYYRQYSAKFYLFAIENKADYGYILDIYSEKEIEKLKNRFLVMSTDEYLELEKLKNDIVDEYNISQYETETTAYLQIFDRFVKVNKKMASLFGYSSYLEYMDKEGYGRKYSTTDTKNFIDNVKKYIVPLYDEIDEIRFSLSEKEINFFKEFKYSSILDTDYNTLSIAKDYSRYIGGSYMLDFHNFLASENYILASGDNSYSTAYTLTNNPFMYLGESNQNVGALIHEFGHYYSAKENYYITDKSLDLNEFYSQSNEALFNIYLEKTYKDLKQVFEVNTFDYIKQALSTIKAGACLREFEEYIYSNTITDVSEYEAIWKNIAKEYNINREFYKYEIIYDVYYISYATSATGALAILREAENDYSSAAKKYVKTITYDDINYDLIEYFNYIDLNDPFNENTFKDIKNYVENKYLGGEIK